MSSSRRSKSRRIKRVLGNIAVVVLGVIALLLLVGLFLPHQYHVERSIDLQAKPEVVYPQIAGLRHWPEWTVWNKELDPTVQFTFDGPDSGVGASYAWTGTKVGQGHLKITQADPAKGVWYDLDFNAGQYPSTGSVTMAAAGDRLRVTWVNEGDFGKNPVNRYFGLAIDRLIGPDFEKGLARLKIAIEGSAPR